MKQPQKTIEFPPPAHLSARSAELWRELAPTVATTTGRRIAFQMALEYLDCANHARAAISAEGLVIKTPSTGALHANPMLRVERESRAEFLKLWKQLGLFIRSSGIENLMDELGKGESK